jgi:SOS-response transcriptional repressor LexA
MRTSGGCEKKQDSRRRARWRNSSIDDLLEDVDPDYERMKARDPARADVEDDIVDVSGYKKDDIPVIAEGDASPQPGLFWDDTGLKADVEDRISRPFDVRDPRAYGVRVRGDSMAPAYRPGMVLVISPNTPVRDGDEVYVQLLDGERLLKVARRMPGGWLLESINPAYEARFVKRSEIGAMHPVLWARRKRSLQRPWSRWRRLRTRSASRACCT